MNDEVIRDLLDRDIDEEILGSDGSESEVTVDNVEDRNCDTDTQSAVESGVNDISGENESFYFGTD